MENLKFDSDEIGFAFQGDFQRGVFEIPLKRLSFPAMFTPCRRVRQSFRESRFLLSAVPQFRLSCWRRWCFDNKSPVSDCYKGVRIVRAAQGRAVSEFGSRRAQGYSGALLGARAAYIAGCTGTSNTLCDMLYGIPSGGTMAHSWVQNFDSEYEAFKAYAEIYPDNCVLLLDTYNVLKSGIVNAVKVFNEVLVPRGFRPRACVLIREI